MPELPKPVYTGNFCPRCGGVRVVREGLMQRCTFCGLVFK